MVLGYFGIGPYSEDFMKRSPMSTHGSSASPLVFHTKVIDYREQHLGDADGYLLKHGQYEEADFAHSNFKGYGLSYLELSGVVCARVSDRPNPFLGLAYPILFRKLRPIRSSVLPEVILTAMICPLLFTTRCRGLTRNGTKGALKELRYE